MCAGGVYYVRVCSWPLSQIDSDGGHCRRRFEDDRHAHTNATITANASSTHFTNSTTTITIPNTNVITALLILPVLLLLLQLLAVSISLSPTPARLASALRKLPLKNVSREIQALNRRSGRPLAPGQASWPPTAQSLLRLACRTKRKRPVGPQLVIYHYY